MHEPNTESANESPLLNLSAPRSIVLRDCDRNFTLLCRTVEKADYLDYFDALLVTSEYTDEGRVSSVESDTAALTLAERVLIGATGYRVQGVESVTDLPNWQTRIPLNHRLALGNSLVAVSPSAPAEDEWDISCALESVSIDAVWPGEGGTMLRFKGLKHFFRTPTAAQHKRFRDAASRSLVVGGSRTGKTIFLGAHAILVDLYDELIDHTEGYATHTVAQMDAYHKFVAAKELFNPVSTVQVAQSGGPAA